MKENNLYRIAVNTILIFTEWVNIAIFAGALVFFFALFAFFYGFLTIPVPGGVLGFYRMVPPTSFEMFYMFFSAIVSALIMTVTVYSMRMKMKGGTNGKSASFVGLATGIFGTICPACLGINFLAFGNVFTAQLSFLIPYIFWVQLGGIVLLSLGLYLVAKSAYEKKCISCSVDENVKDNSKTTVKSGGSISNKKFIALAVVVIALFSYQIYTLFAVNNTVSNNTQSNIITTDKGVKINVDDFLETVTPKKGFETNVKWGDIVSKMVKAGVLDPNKLEDILTKRYGQTMKPEWRDVLSGKNSNLSINNDNAVFMMYVLWTFAKHNKNQILVDSPFAKYFKNYDIGVGRAGYGDTNLLVLTAKQQAVVKRVAENANRPCCNNSTAAPDCSHGYSALGLVELMASQGFSEKEIFATFVKFNSFWFPETYIKDALYFKITKGQDWANVDKEIIAGPEYSSLGGSYKVKYYLKQNFGI